MLCHRRCLRELLGTVWDNTGYVSFCHLLGPQWVLIFLKSCNAKHGFYIFKYVYSFSTRRNQTQIKKEEADRQRIIPSHRLDEGNARREPPAGSAGTVPEHSDNSSSEVIEYGIVFSPENRSTPSISRDGPSPQPGTGMRVHGSGGGMGPTPSSSEGSGDLDLVVEGDGGVPILPQGEHPSEVVVGNSLRDSRLTGEDEEGATTIGVDRGLTTPVPWRVTSGDITSPTVASIHGKDDDEVREEGQKSKGKPDHVATTTPHHRGDVEATITVPAKGDSIRPALTEGFRTTPSVTASSHRAGMGTVLGRGGSGEVGTATSTPSRVEARPGAGMRVRPGGAGLDKTPRTDKAPFPSGKPSGGVSSGGQKSVGDYDGDAGGRSQAAKAGASPAPQAGQATGSMAAGRGREQGRALAGWAAAPTAPIQASGVPTAASPPRGTGAATARADRRDCSPQGGDPQGTPKAAGSRGPSEAWPLSTPVGSSGGAGG
ncbi:hypothetical protein EK904_000682 [Melospiza melodia maxima]|nr:hypothetical protein EK904_000682 [Melospiza melodia maxima]